MARIENPYDGLRDGEWLKGNLHTHTTASDGQRPHQEVIDEYAGLGHGFLMISDHDVYTSEQDYEKFDARGMILLPGNEISKNAPHVLHVGPGGLVEPYEDRQAVIDAVSAGGGFVMFNHPNWFARFDHFPQELMERWRGYTGLEIYNGVISRLEGSPYATNRWDMLLSQGRRLWGFANDDSHRAEGDVGHGWNTAFVRERTVQGVMDALGSGRFYGSTGVEITNIAVNGNRIEVATTNAARIVALRDNAARFAQVDDKAISVEVPQGVSYVRFECWGTGEAFAWTQPFYVRT